MIKRGIMSMRWRNYHCNIRDDLYCDTHMTQKHDFYKEFNTLDYVLKNARSVLLMPHMNPDLDAVGSVVAFFYFIKKFYKKNVVIACFDAFPDTMKGVISHVEFTHPDDLDLTQFDVAIGCDSVERGFHTLIKKLPKDCVTIAIDHHHDITLEADISMIDSAYAATCEILYDFFVSRVPHPFDKNIAMALLAGIIGDTGAFQHANTSSDILAKVAHLIKNGASITKIISTLFTNREIETLNVWGSALEHTKFFPESGLAVTAITQENVARHRDSLVELSNIASMLTTVPRVRVALVIYQADTNMIKGSLRAEKHADMDVSAIAHTLGGGGHPLASGFSMPGRIEEVQGGGWRIV